uniref:Ig-like domain-containing protein n=1 Tax=Panagrolaimus sp. JU765 TaxID=591449 RepID=A0AC34RIZ1_9BILA
MARVIVIRDQKECKFLKRPRAKPAVSLQRDRPYPTSLIGVDGLLKSEDGSGRFFFAQEKKQTVPEFTCRLDDQWHHHGDSVSLRIGFKGFPEPNVTWFKDQQPITPCMKIMIYSTATSSELVIMEAQKSDAGFYTCRIENPLGVRDTNCLVHIGDNDRIKSTGHKTLIANSRLYRSVIYKPNLYYSYF